MTVSERGFQGEGAQLAAFRRNKTPTVESLYTIEGEAVQRTYAQAWDWENNPVDESQPVRRRVGAKSKQPVHQIQGVHASSSAPGRSSSVGTTCKEG